MTIVIKTFVMAASMSPVPDDAGRSPSLPAFPDLDFVQITAPDTSTTAMHPRKGIADFDPAAGLGHDPVMVFYADADKLVAEVEAGARATWELNIDSEEEVSISSLPLPKGGR